MRHDISQKIREYAIKNPAIESIFFVRSFNDDEFTKIYTVVNDIIIGKLEEELVDLFDGLILVRRRKESESLDKKDFSYTTIDLYLKDNVKISESIIADDMAEDFIGTLPSDIEFLYNRPGSKFLNPNQNFTYGRVKEYEFSQNTKNFFASAIEVSFYIRQGNYLAASIKMEEVRSELISMLRVHVREKYHGSRDIGVDGRELTHSLAKEYKDELLETFSDAQPLNIYDSLFKACVLFRKVGMDSADKLGFSYARETDVKSMRLLRENYKKLESFLN